MSEISKAILKKQAEVKSLAEKLQKAKTVIAFDYHGLTVSDLTNLRKQIHKENCEITILKNNITRRAAENLGYKEFSKELTGPKALAISYDDIVVPAKALVEFAKKNKSLQIVTGIVEGTQVDKSYLEKLANIPPKDQLLTMLAVGMLAPLRQLGIGLNLLKEQKQN